MLRLSKLKESRDQMTPEKYLQALQKRMQT